LYLNIWVEFAEIWIVYESSIIYTTYLPIHQETWTLNPVKVTITKNRVVHRLW